MKVYRTQSLYTPATAAPALIVTEIDAPEPVLALFIMPGTVDGDVLLGVEHDAATRKALPSPESRGSEEPLTMTICPLLATGTARGVTLEMVAVEKQSERESERGQEKPTH